MNLEDRNNPKGIGIAQRTRKNLEHIRDQVDQNNKQVHVVVQLVNSLLGLVVVPQQRKLSAHIRQVKLAELKGKGWPEWDITKGKARTTTLGDLIYHIRNATAHGHFEFSGHPNSPNLSEVILEVADGPPPQNGKPWTANWRAKMRGDDLYSFCILFSTYIEGDVD